MNTQMATIITGGGRGIGRAIALRMARETSVLLVGRTQASLEAACAEITAAGGSADFVVGDVADPAVAQLAVDKVKARGWTIRNLVANAGFGKGGAAATFDRDTWRKMFDVNVHGTFWFVQACLPSMIENKAGSIAIIASIAGVKGVKYNTAYAATKHALVGMARSLALENAKHGIVVVPVCPGFVESDMTQQTIAGLMKHRGIDEAAARTIIAETNPQKRIIPASEVAEAVALVAGGSLAAVNGNPLMLTGGE